jgi:hypothetical protein
MIFRSDMVGPSFGKLAASVIFLLLIETVSMEILLPPWTSTYEALVAAYGRNAVFCAGTAASTGLVFWGVGGLMALPALLHIRHWKIQPNKDADIGKLVQSMPLIVVNFVMNCLLVPPIFLHLLPESSFDMRALPSVQTLARDVAVWFFWSRNTCSSTSTGGYM